VKIFVIHASAGAGHKKIAEAIGGQAVDLYGKDSVRIIDILDYTPALFKFFYTTGYISLISRLKWLWAILFFLSDTKYMGLFNNNLRRFNNKLFCRRFLGFIKKENPDVIISTHFLVNELVSYLKQRGSIKTRLLSIVTDFGVHNFWIAPNVDTYIAASSRTQEILISKKVDKERIRVLGIPVRKQFQKQIERESARNKIGIKRDGFTALILTGGIGMGPIYEIARILGEDINIIVVCGNNRNLYNKLKQLNMPNLIVLGWIDYVEEVMAACDIVVTKPGGSTISECLVTGLPMIFFSIIPGQEMQNARIISDNGMGFILRKPEQIKEKILYFKHNPAEISSIKKKIESFRFMNSSHNILALIRLRQPMK